jgi:hypothetical protein
MSYWLWCDVLCDPETSRMGRPWPALGCSATGKKNFKVLQKDIFSLNIIWSASTSVGKYILTIICIFDDVQATVPVDRRPNITAENTAFIR